MDSIMAAVPCLRILTVLGENNTFITVDI